MKVKGEVTVVSPDGVILAETRNLTVSTAKEILRNLVAGANVNSHILTKVGLGTGTTPPAETDTQLENEVARVPIVNYTFLDYNVVEFEAYADQNTANGYTLTEVGLFTEGDPATEPQGKLFARALIPGITKDSTISFYVKWRLTFI